MRAWQFNVLFGLAVCGSAFMLFAPYLGLDAEPSPAAVTGICAILTFVLNELTRKKNDDEREDKDVR